VRRWCSSAIRSRLRPARIDARAFRSLVERLRRNARLNVRRLGSCRVDAAVSLLDYPDEIILVSAGAASSPSRPARGHTASRRRSCRDRSDLLGAALDDEYWPRPYLHRLRRLVSLSSLEPFAAIRRAAVPPDDAVSTLGERLRKTSIMCMSFLRARPRRPAMPRCTKLLRLSSALPAPITPSRSDLICSAQTFRSTPYSPSQKLENKITFPA